jgi:beta-galactosidase
MRYPLSSIGISLLFIFCLLSPQSGQANGSIYPPTPAAQNAINWKDGYFSINGKPTFITSGEMHYARIPRELWRDRIWRSKQMGFNCMQMYVFWNATESKEGEWNFTDNLDLDAWLSLVQEMGMYAIVRVGPYSCAEWEQGGFPAWLTSKPGMTLRDSGPLYLPQVDRHLAQVEKIVAKHQINHGGNVIMVQLENEHPHGWGTDDKDPYLKHLVEQARTNGLEIPLFLSGLHHGSDPSGEQPYQVGNSPWFTTEFWTGWIGKYGDMDAGMLNQKIRGTWKIMAFGGAGYDYYMVHGGTNFGYSGFTYETTYDYSAPIGEAGQLRNFYFPARRAAYFAQSFSSLLTGSHNDADFAKSDQPGLRVTTRTIPTGGSIIFIDDFSNKGDTSKPPEIAPDASAYQAPSAEKGKVVFTRLSVRNMTLPHQGYLKVSPIEPSTVIVNLPWTDSTSFESICTNVLMRQPIGNTEYWVCYGTAGDNGEVTVKRKTTDGSPSQFDFTYPSDASVKEIDIDSGDGHHAKLLVMNTELTKKTWFAHGKLYIGPSFVLDDGGVEFPPEGGQAAVYAATGKSEITQKPISVPATPTLPAWEWRDASAERSPDFSMKGWSQSKGPQAIESYDGFQNRYGWYRTLLHRDSAGPFSLHFSGQSGDFSVFLNGQPASFDHLDAKAGDNVLAVLVKAGPRPTMYKFTGPIGTLNYRGLWGGVSTDQSPTVPNASWKQWTGSGNPTNPEAISKPGYADSGWKAVAGGKRIKVGKGSSWLRCTFNITASQVDSSLQIPNPGDEQTAIYLNGQRLASWSQDVSKILVPGDNAILLVSQSKKGGDFSLPVTLWHNSKLSQTPWYFHGGLDDLQETAIIGRVTNWSDFLAEKPWKTGDPAPANLPTFWKSTFTYHHTAGIRETVGLRTAAKAKAGHVWLNGHNLGEYPQKALMYMPECWLKEGDNDLVIFDINGNKPEHIEIARYETFSVASPQ